MEFNLKKTKILWNTKEREVLFEFQAILEQNQTINSKVDYKNSEFVFVWNFNDKVNAHRANTSDTALAPWSRADWFKKKCASIINKYYNNSWNYLEWSYIQNSQTTLQKKGQ